jgi:hypothetical protein
LTQPGSRRRTRGLHKTADEVHAGGDNMISLPALHKAVFDRELVIVVRPLRKLGAHGQHGSQMGDALFGWIGRMHGSVSGRREFQGSLHLSRRRYRCRWRACANRAQRHACPCPSTTCRQPRHSGPWRGWRRCESLGTSPATHRRHGLCPWRDLSCFLKATSVGPPSPLIKDLPRRRAPRGRVPVRHAFAFLSVALARAHKH